MRYFPMWNVSEECKEYIVSCLFDYCSYCRNDYLHKEIIDVDKYEIVERIRDNTRVCLYYILGGFKLFDSDNSVNEQLGIMDYSFEVFYQSLKYTKHLKIKTISGYEGYVVYLNRDNYHESDEVGRLKENELRFLKIDSIITKIDNNRIQYDYNDLQTLLNDENFMSENTIVVTRNAIPIHERIFVKVK